MSWDDAHQASEQLCLMGPAFCFTADDPFVGLDLDDCLDEKREPLDWAKPILEQFDTYTEISPSLRGLKLYMRGKLPDDIRHSVQVEGGGIEIYDRGRFFAFTGVGFHRVPVRDCQAGIDALVEQYLQRPKVAALVPATPMVGMSLYGRAMDYVQNAERPLAGGRNNAAYRLAGHLIAMVGDNDERLSHAEVVEAVQAWNSWLTEPLDPQEIEQVCESAARTGTPREIKRSERPIEDLSAFQIERPLPPPPQVEEKYEPMEACPGFIGLLTQHILDTSMYPQPELALGAAVTCLSVLTGRKVKSGRTRTNVYALAIAPSGSGKDHPRQVVKELLHSINASELAGPERIGSHAGLVKRLVISPACWFPLDEIGRLIQTMQTPKASHLYNIGTVLMQLYTSSGTYWVGDAYAEADRTPQIDDPHCVLYGSTVPETLWSGLGRDAITGGLLGRCMLFEGHYVLPQEPQDLSLPQVLMDAAEWWYAYNPGGGNLSPDPVNYPLTAEASDCLRGHISEIAKRRIEEDEFAAALWSRVGERTAKLALLAACSRSGVEVNLEDVQWAKKLSNTMARRLLKQIDRYHVDAENEDEKTIRRVLQVIKDEPGITQRGITRKTQWIKGGRRARNEVIQHLIDSGQINHWVRDVYTDGRRNPVCFFPVSQEKNHGTD